METSIKDFVEFFDGVIERASIKFKFYDHVNNRDSFRNACFPDGCKYNSPNIINALDFLYFACVKSLTNCTYDITNSCMINEQLTEVTTSAYKKKAQRKTYEFFAYIFNELNTYYNDKCLVKLQKNEKYKDLA